MSKLLSDSLQFYGSSARYVGDVVFVASIQRYNGVAQHEYKCIRYPR
jgi:hypothetical protein